MTASYLPHLDGIRAIALAGVLLFHFDVHPFQGGYVGVDVFLTLSGYLITRNIGIALHSKSGFSIRSFYVRRFFRLYPTSLVCTFVSAVLAVSMFPSHLVLSTLKSSLASMAFVANVYFYLTTGYFDHGAHEKPLLHHWSLSLEEQYYLIWPPLLMIVVHCLPCLQRSILTGLLGSLSLTSFAAALIFSNKFSSFTFFMLPTRIFQFAVGALYAVVHWPEPSETDIQENTCISRHLPSSSFPVISEIVSLLGAVAIIGSYVLIPSGASPLYIVPLTVGTLILIARPNTLFSTRILSNSVLTLIGRLSYSAYLVHWPIYVYLRFTASALHLKDPPLFLYTLSTFVLAILLYHGVERPFRKPRSIQGFLVLILMGMTIVFCREGIRNNGFQQRMCSRTKPAAQTGYATVAKSTSGREM